MMAAVIFGRCKTVLVGRDLICNSDQTLLYFFQFFNTFGRQIQGRDLAYIGMESSHLEVSKRRFK